MKGVHTMKRTANRHIHLGAHSAATQPAKPGARTTAHSSAHSALRTTLHRRARQAAIHKSLAVSLSLLLVFSLFPTGVGLAAADAQQDAPASAAFQEPQEANEAAPTDATPVLTTESASGEETLETDSAPAEPTEPETTTAPENADQPEAEQADANTAADESGGAEPATAEETPSTLTAEADGRTISVSGNIPEGAELQVTAIPQDTAKQLYYAYQKNLLDEYNIEHAGEEGFAPLIAMPYSEAADIIEVGASLDIAIVADGEKWEPKDHGEEITVTISGVDPSAFVHYDVEITDGDGRLNSAQVQSAIESIECGEADVEVIPVEYTQEGISFTTDSLSPYTQADIIGNRASENTVFSKNVDEHGYGIPDGFTLAEVKNLIKDENLAQVVYDTICQALTEAQKDSKVGTRQDNDNAYSGNSYTSMSVAYDAIDLPVPAPLFSGEQTSVVGQISDRSETSLIWELAADSKGRQAKDIDTLPSLLEDATSDEEITKLVLYNFAGDIDASGKNIRYVDGLVEYMPNAGHIDLSNNLITDLTPFARSKNEQKVVRFRNIDVSGNPILAAPDDLMSTISGSNVKTIQDFPKIDTSDSDPLTFTFQYMIGDHFENITLDNGFYDETGSKARWQQAANFYQYQGINVEYTSDSDATFHKHAHGLAPNNDQYNETLDGNSSPMADIGRARSEESMTAPTYYEVKTKYFSTIETKAEQLFCGTLTMQKVSNTNGKPVVGAQYKLYEYEEEADGTPKIGNQITEVFEVETKTNDEGVTTTVPAVDADGNPAMRTITPEELTTDANGNINLKGLNVGKYILKEVKAPAGYMLDDEELNELHVIVINPAAELKITGGLDSVKTDKKDVHIQLYGVAQTPANGMDEVVAAHQGRNDGNTATDIYQLYDYSDQAKAQQEAKDYAFGKNLSDKVPDSGYTQDKHESSDTKKFLPANINAAEEHPEAMQFGLVPDDTKNNEDADAPLTVFEETYTATLNRWLGNANSTFEGEEDFATYIKDPDVTKHLKERGGLEQKDLDTMDASPENMAKVIQAYINVGNSFQEDLLKKPADSAVQALYKKFAPANFVITRHVTYESQDVEVKKIVPSSDGKRYEKIDPSDDPQPVYISPIAVKELKGQAVKGGEFSFTLKCTGVEGQQDLVAGWQTVTGIGDTVDYTDIAFNDVDGLVRFNTLRFTRPGIYTYVITENVGTDSDVRYDTDKKTYTMTVKVEEEDSTRHDKGLKATVNGQDFYSVGTTNVLDQSALVFPDSNVGTFTNEKEIYPVAVKFAANKEFDGKDPETFTFNLKGASDKGDIDVDKDINWPTEKRAEFDTIRFDKSGEYSFTIKEKPGNSAIDYDETEHKVNVLVNEIFGSELVAGVFIDKDIPAAVKQAYKDYKDAYKDKENENWEQNVDHNRPGDAKTYDNDYAKALAAYDAAVEAALKKLEDKVKILDDSETDNKQATTKTFPVIPDTANGDYATAINDAKEAYDTAVEKAFNEFVEAISDKEATYKKLEAEYLATIVINGGTVVHGRETTTIVRTSDLKEAAAFDTKPDSQIPVIDAATFDNKAKPYPVNIKFKADKTFDGEDGKEFTFKLEPQNGAPGETSEKTITWGQSTEVIFDTIEFTKEGVFTYKLYEVKGTDPDIDYDTTARTVTVVVKNIDGKGMGAVVFIDKAKDAQELWDSFVGIFETSDEDLQKAREALDQAKENAREKAIADKVGKDAYDDALLTAKKTYENSLVEERKTYHNTVTTAKDKYEAERDTIRDKIREDYYKAVDSAVDGKYQRVIDLLNTKQSAYDAKVKDINDKYDRYLNESFDDKDKTENSDDSTQDAFARAYRDREDAIEKAEQGFKDALTAKSHGRYGDESVIDLIIRYIRYYPAFEGLTEDEIIEALRDNTTYDDDRDIGEAVVAARNARNIALESAEKDYKKAVEAARDDELAKLTSPEEAKREALAHKLAAAISGKALFGQSNPSDAAKTYGPITLYDEGTSNPDDNVIFEVEFGDLWEAAQEDLKTAKSTYDGAVETAADIYKTNVETALTEFNTKANTAKSAYEKAIEEEVAKKTATEQEAYNEALKKAKAGASPETKAAYKAKEDAFVAKQPIWGTDTTNWNKEAQKFQAKPESELEKTGTSEFKNTSGPKISKTSDKIGQDLQKGDTINYTLNYTLTLANPAKSAVTVTVKDELPSQLEANGNWKLDGVDQGETWVGSATVTIPKKDGDTDGQVIITIPCKVKADFDTGTTPANVLNNIILNQASLTYGEEGKEKTRYTEVIANYLVPAVSYEMDKVRTTPAPGFSDDWFGFVPGTKDVEYQVKIKNTGDLPLTMTVTDAFNTGDADNFENVRITAVANATVDSSTPLPVDAAAGVKIKIAKGDEAIVTILADVKSDATPKLDDTEADTTQSERVGGKKGAITPDAIKSVSESPGGSPNKHGYENTAVTKDAVSDDYKKPTGGTFTYKDKDGNDVTVSIENGKVALPEGMSKEDAAFTPTTKDDANFTSTDTDGIGDRSDIAKTPVQPKASYQMKKERLDDADVKNGEAGRYGFFPNTDVEYKISVQNTGEVPLTMDVTDSFDAPGDSNFENIRYTAVENATWNKAPESDDAKKANTTPPNITIEPGETAKITVVAHIKADAKERLAADGADKVPARNDDETDWTYATPDDATTDKGGTLTEAGYADGYVNTAKTTNVEAKWRINPETGEKVDSNEDGGTEVTKSLEDKNDYANTPVQETVKITVTKTWDDADIRGAQTTGENAYAREDVTFTITASPALAEGTTVGGVTFTDGATATLTISAPAEGNSAQKVISGLPKYIDGTKVEYTVTENVPDGFKQTEATTNVSISDATNEGEGSATNAPDSREKTGELTITVKKVDGASESKAVLAGAEFTLAPPAGSTSEPVVLVTGEDGMATFTLTEVGTYSLKETKAPEGYKLGSTEWKITTDRELASITKVTEGEGDEAQTFWQWIYNLIFKGEQSSDAFEFNADEKTGTLTVENAPLTTKVGVSKTWADANDQDGKRASIGATVQLYRQLEGESEPAALTGDAYTVNVGTTNGWTHTWEKLPAYIDGKKATYSVVESLPQGSEYANTATGDPVAAVPGQGDADGDSGTIALTNSYEPATTSVTFTKTWADNNDANGNRPSADEFVVMLALTNDSGVDTSNVAPQVADNEDGTYTVTWTGLPLNAPKTDASAETKAVIYTVTEDASKLPAYKASVDSGAASGSGENIALALTNTEELVQITVTKIWNDADNQDGIRPESVTVRLFADGTEVASAEISAEDEWAYSFEDLPKYAEGTEIVYTVEEVAVEGYETSVEGDATTGYTITNKHTPKPKDDEQPGPKDDDGTQSDDKKGGQVNQDKTPTSSPKPSGTKTVASTGTPKTGDTANPALWLVLAFASLCVLLVSYGMRRFAYAGVGAGARTGAGVGMGTSSGARAKHGKHAASGKHARSRRQ